MDEDEALKFFAEIEGRPPRCHGMSLPAESSDEAGKEEWFASDEFDPEALDELDNSERLPDDDIPDITHDGTGRTQTFSPVGSSLPLAALVCSWDIIVKLGRSGTGIMLLLILRISNKICRSPEFSKLNVCILPRVRNTRFPYFHLREAYPFTVP